MWTPTSPISSKSVLPLPYNTRLISEHCFPTQSPKLDSQPLEADLKWRSQISLWTSGIWMSVGRIHESAFFKKKFSSVSLTCSIKLQKFCLGKTRLANPKKTTGEGSAAQSFAPLSSSAFPDFPFKRPPCTSLLNLKVCTRKVKVLVAKSYATLCYSMDCSPPGSCVYGSLQARILLEWVALLFYRGSSWPRDWTQVSCIAGGFFTVWATMEAQVCIYIPIIFGLPTFKKTLI